MDNAAITVTATNAPCLEIAMGPSQRNTSSMGKKYKDYAWVISYIFDLTGLKPFDLPKTVGGAELRAGTGRSQ
jgi:hypothetical protein